MRQILTKFLVLLPFCLPLSACSQATIKGESCERKISETRVERCEISDSERDALLSLDYNAFDQSLPDGGWRKYQACPLLTRDLIDAYTSKHSGTLEKQQWDVLVWHSGQISGFAGDYADAIAKMQQTTKPKEKPTDAFLWNPYVRASIAFLKKDKRTLLSARKRLASGMSPFNRINLRQVDAFIRCFNSSYEDAYSHKCSPQETNVERIKTLAIPVDLKRPLPSDFFGLSDFLRMKKIILVGEMHGTKTVPELFGNLVASIANEKAKTLVVLEINQSSQPAINDFLKTLDAPALKKDPFFSREYQDGRSSKAMVALLKKLAHLTNVTVMCMDPMEGILTMTGQERDTGMASFINSNRVGFDQTLVLSGNVHSSTEIGTRWDKNYRPMGYELKSMAKDLRDDQLFNILIRYGKIDSWNCEGAEASSCGARFGQNISSDYSEAVPFPSYFIWENEMPDGHQGTIFIRSAKISFPFATSRAR
jgi:hypothetical protein